MFLLKCREHFSAAHFISGYKGKCGDIHGHNWVVEVTVQAYQLDELGMAYDFSELKNKLGEVLHKLDHKNLNTLRYFEEHNPTAENIAKFIAHKLTESLPDHVSVREILVEETPCNSLVYIPDENL